MKRQEKRMINISIREGMLKHLVPTGTRAVSWLRLYGNERYRERKKKKKKEKKRKKLHDVWNVWKKEGERGGKNVGKLTIVKAVLGQSKPLVSHGIVIIALTSGDADRCHL